MELPNISAIRTDIESLKRFWSQRNIKFLEWYKILTLVDTLQSRGLESYVSNEPQTFYNMAHFLLTRGELSHSIPIDGESSIEMDRRAKVDRSCQYCWKQIDRERQLGGAMPYLDELAHYLLVTGWYSTVFYFDKSAGSLKAQVWNPYDVYPRYANNKLIACVHSYKITDIEARLKARENGWKYEERGTGDLILDDYWNIIDGVPHNIILIDGKPVTPWVARPEMEIIVAPVGGFPDRGSLSSGSQDWRKLAGRSIFEANESVSLAFNKWKTMVSQILRDTAQPILIEHSQSPVATPEQARERGALFHYAVGEPGLSRLPPAAIPIEVQAHLMEIRRELQKGSFNDAVWGMVEGESGYALSALASSSANQILYPYMDAKHFVIGEGDRFWLSNLKASKKVFEVKGKFIEKLKPTDIPEDVIVIVESEVATPKDWLERGTIANYLKDYLDKATLLKEVLKQSDPQGIIRRQKLDRILDSMEAQTIEKIAGFRGHAKYLEARGDYEQARLFMKAAEALEMQLGAPAPGQGAPLDMARIEAAREAGHAPAIPRVRPGIAPPEAVSGFTPQMLRNMIGQGKLIRR